MTTMLSRFEIYVDDRLRFIKHSVRDRDIIAKLLDQKGIKYYIKEIKFY